MDVTTLMVGGIPLVAVIFGLIEALKSLGLKGRWLALVSLLLGLILGILYKIAASGMPVGYAAWFAVVIFGLALGLITSGFYDFADARFPPVSGQGSTPSGQTPFAPTSGDPVDPMTAQGLTQNMTQRASAAAAAAGATAKQ